MRGRLSIRLAHCEADFQRIYRFRYDVYVTEMGRSQTYADHDARTIVEPYDQTARNYMALSGTELLGVMRTNYYRDGGLECYRELYSFDLFPRENWETFAVTTKLMFRAAARNSLSTVRLACRGYEDELYEGITTDFIDCNPHLEPFFQKLGYRPYRARLQHPEYGDVLPLRLDLHDLEHLRAVRSPFARILQEFRAKSIATAWDLSLIGAH